MRWRSKQAAPQGGWRRRSRRCLPSWTRCPLRDSRPARASYFKNGRGRSSASSIERKALTAQSVARAMAARFSFDRIADTYEETRRLPPQVLDWLAEQLAGAVGSGPLLYAGVGTGRYAQA